MVDVVDVESGHTVKDLQINKRPSKLSGKNMDTTPRQFSPGDSCLYQDDNHYTPIPCTFVNYCPVPECCIVMMYGEEEHVLIGELTEVVLPIRLVCEPPDLQATSSTPKIWDIVCKVHGHLGRVDGDWFPQEGVDRIVDHLDSHYRGVLDQWQASFTPNMVHFERAL